MRTDRSRRRPTMFRSCKLIFLTTTIAWLAGESMPVTFSAPARATFETIGHRGASGYAPECTLAAYRLAVRMNVDYIELDLQLTRDGHIVVMHDETVDRTTDGHGAIGQLTLAELKRLDAGSWFNDEYPIYARAEYIGERVPTLREAFETFGDGTKYLLETKSPRDNPGLEEKTWALVEEFGLRNRVAVQSFSKKSLRKMRKLSPDVRLFQLIWYNHPSTISRDKIKDIKEYANGIGVNFGKINEAYVRKVKLAGLLLYPYTVNRTLNMDRAMRWGADGVHTDYPDRFKEAIEKHRQSEE
ncbi:glycerophosphodiester phosphodiesterase [Cohnella sp. GCM10027633]|uniref:glycerophosphodiester phosphodiesterase n=1 Tax=unclassified Cohnella TaxID=2636738 RepID=UPI003645510B